MKKLISTKLLGAFIVAASMMSTNLFAQADIDTMMIISPIATDRPDQTETPSLVPKGYFQMENGFSI
ncbi:MAG: hypothetical protein ABIQ11_02450, partial [Saprospiraceae bacterium]